jgi:hypothetical protein
MADDKATSHPWLELGVGPKKSQNGSCEQDTGTGQLFHHSII